MIFFDTIGFYDCLALISLADYRKEDGEASLWVIINRFIREAMKFEDAKLLLRIMEILGKQRPVLRSMGEKLVTELTE